MVLSEGRLKMGRNLLHGTGIGESKRITAPYSESDILYLQNIFTSPGFHQFTVSSVLVGRELILQQLRALKWHQDVGYISTINTASIEAESIVDLIGQPIDQDSVESFFIDQFYYDFLWIEGTRDLMAMPWIYIFEQQILHYRIDQMIPIITVNYQTSI